MHMSICIVLNCLQLGNQLSIYYYKFKWPKGRNLIEVMNGFKDLCGLLVIHDAINVT